MTINGYVLNSELQNANSGFSKWGFAKKNGKEYFIKELIDPVYPMEKDIMGEAMYQNRLKFCSEYEQKFSEYFTLINEAGRGNLTRIIEFFRCDSHYYIVTEKVEGISLSMDQIAALPDEDKLLLMKTAAAAFGDLHRAGIVHFDVKPSNIMVKRTAGGKLCAKIIDFDSGFRLGDMLESDDLGGDLTYLAPETFLGIAGEDVAVNEKADIFALGLIFHEYYCGTLPFYDKTSYDYPYECALDTGTLGISKDRLPKNLYELIVSMLDPDPAKRPKAEEIVLRLDHIFDELDPTLNIDYLGVNFGGDCGKSIALYPTCICYCNTSYPIPVPDSFYQHKQTAITPELFADISLKLKEIGLFRILKQRKGTYSGTVAHGLSCTLGNGVTYDYVEGGIFEDKFAAICDLISSYCSFEKAASAPPPPPPPPPPQTPTGSFFRRAGNL